MTRATLTSHVPVPCGLSTRYACSYGEVVLPSILNFVAAPHAPDEVNLVSMENSTFPPLMSPVDMSCVASPFGNWMVTIIASIKADETVRVTAPETLLTGAPTMTSVRTEGNPGM